MPTNRRDAASKRKKHFTITITKSQYKPRKEFFSFILEQRQLELQYLYIFFFCYSTLGKMYDFIVIFDFYLFQTKGKLNVAYFIVRKETNIDLRL